MNSSVKRNKQFVIRLSEEELEKLNNDVKRTAYCREEYVRQLIKGNTPVELPSSDYREIIRQIRRIGYNIDQIAKVAHTKGFIDSLSYKKQSDMLFDLCTRLDSVPIYIEGLRRDGYV